MNIKEKVGKENGLILEIKRNKIILDEEKIEFVYRLMELSVPDRIFLVEVKSSFGDHSAFVETDEAAAEKLYECFVEGKVGPDTAKDVFRDILTDNLM